MIKNFDLDKLKVTINNDLYDHSKCRLIHLKTFVNLTKNGKYKTIVNLHRKNLNQHEYDDYLKRLLPKVILDGEYKKRSHDGLIKYHGIMLFDCDDVSDYNRMRELVINLTKPFILFKSISNDLKFGFLTDITDVKYYEYAYKFVLTQLEKTFKIYKDIENLKYKFDYISHGMGTFVTFDPDIYYDNKNSNFLNIQNDVKLHYEEELLKRKQRAKILRFKKKHNKTNSNNTYKILDKLLEFLDNNGLCMTETYYDWQEVAMCLYNTIEDFDLATDYFYNFSCTYEFFNEKNFNKEVKKFERMITDNMLKKEITVGTLIYKAKLLGFSTK